jgi:hypothetical protein
MLTWWPATPTISPKIPPTGQTTIPSSSPSMTAATNRIQNPPYRVSGIGELPTGTLYAGTASGCVAGCAVTVSDDIGPAGMPALKGVPQFAQNLDCAEFCVPHWLQKIIPFVMSGE